MGSRTVWYHSRTIRYPYGATPYSTATTKAVVWHGTALYETCGVIINTVCTATTCIGCMVWCGMALYETPPPPLTTQRWDDTGSDKSLLPHCIYYVTSDKLDVSKAISEHVSLSFRIAVLAII